MNRVHIIREAIGRIVSMLTMRRIKVTQRGMQAAVYYHPKTGEIMHVNIPFLPDDASDEFIAAVQGFLDHEVGHVLFTDANVLREANKLGNRIANMANLVEDVYVETKMAKQFSGSGMNLQNTSKFHLERILRPEINKAIEAGDTKAAMGNVAIAAFRAWGGQTVAADFLKSDPKIADLANELKSRVGDDLVNRLSKITSSADALDIAKKVIDKLKEQAAPPPPSAPAPAPAPAPTPAPPPPAATEPDEDDEEEDDAPPVTPPGASEEADDDAETEVTTAESDADAEADGDADAEAEADGEADVDAEAEDDKDDDKDDGDSDASSVASPTQGDDGEDDDAPQQPSLPSPGGADPSEGEGDEDEDGPSGTTPDDEASPIEDGTPDGSSETGTKPPLDDVFDDAHDYDQEVSKALTIEAGDQIKNADYIVFSTEWDFCGPAVPTNREDGVEQLADKTRHMVAGMQKQLERALVSRERRGWNPGQRKGKLNPGSLFKAMTGDDRLFRKRYEVSGKQTVVSLVNDCSGSMSGERIQTAAIASFAIAEVLERLKMDFEISGFTTRDCSEMQSAIEAEESATGVFTNYSRDEALHLPIFKAFGERFDPRAKARVALMCDEYANQRTGGLLQCNIDGESIALAAHRLLQQKAERRVLLVLSDGQPAGSPGHGLRQHLQRTVKDIEASGVDVVGIGIQSFAVKDYYKKFVVLHNVADLPTIVMAQLTQLLLAP